MTYTSLEQRAAQGYLELFPQFIADSQAPVSVSEQKAFYDLMERFYRLAYEEPLLFVPRLHEDAVLPGLYSSASAPGREAQDHACPDPHRVWGRGAQPVPLLSGLSVLVAGRGRCACG